MASNFFGHHFRISTFGESHGKCIGVVIDGCPAGLAIQKEEIDQELVKRRPGHTAYTSSRQEPDEVDILSGIFEGHTTGAPIALLIHNRDVDSSHYESIQTLLRPGHAQYTYLKKYGIFDAKGGGRASARETAARVAAGAIAKKFLAHHNIRVLSFLQELGGIGIQNTNSFPFVQEQLKKSAIFCPDPIQEERMIRRLKQVQEEGNSVGGIVATMAEVPSGLGEPMYHKLPALLAFAMFSIPAVKGFEIGAGFHAAQMTGTEHNHTFGLNEQHEICIQSDPSGGTLGGISNGALLQFKVAFKPTSSIKLPQPTRSLQKEEAIFQLPEGSRHDPCVAIRAVPVVETMCALVLTDTLLANRLTKL